MPGAVDETICEAVVHEPTRDWAVERTEERWETAVASSQG
eukprot:CAMPEP_0197565720 /NCGR_PEP_ID=MMETSP1320-20131121/32635_1 /TAXON_ID=91990 /ORGANISM="Bolidomonas sp., Strain RCC2347" /LENGTH=39 /DNA_ID= /DNA_START= /DNA_END= /DNA_ORIENTATION=